MNRLPKPTRARISSFDFPTPTKKEPDELSSEENEESILPAYEAVSDSEYVVTVQHSDNSVLDIHSDESGDDYFIDAYKDQHGLFADSDEDGWASPLADLLEDSVAPLTDLLESSLSEGECWD